MVVQAHTFRILGTRLSPELPAGLLERMRDVGEQMRRKLDEKSVEKELRRTARALRKLRRRLRKLPVTRGRRAIGKGITATYREARRGARGGSADPTPERFHDWRKQVKVLSNELQDRRAARSPSWRRAISTRSRSWARSSGRCTTSTARPRRPSATRAGSARKPSVRRCAALVAEHRVVLEREAFALAAGVFAGRPRDVRELVETGWEIWRKRAAKAEEVATEEAA